jgi:hypothetical protein
MHPIESLPLQRLDGLPGTFLANQLRFVKAVDRLSQSSSTARILPVAFGRGREAKKGSGFNKI